MSKQVAIGAPGVRIPKTSVTSRDDTYYYCCCRCCDGDCDDDDDTGNSTSRSLPPFETNHSKKYLGWWLVRVQICARCHRFYLWEEVVVVVAVVAVVAVVDGVDRISVPILSPTK